MAVAVVERFKKELMYLLAAETKKLAFVERWPCLLYTSDAADE